jgi:predicted nucleotidyltransferase
MAGIRPARRLPVSATVDAPTLARPCWQDIRKLILAAMNKREAVAELKRHADAVKALGATSLYLFGSVARDEAKSSSDLDLFIDYDPDGKFSLLELVGIKLLLEEKLGVEVDVTTRDSLHPMLRTEIERSAVRVF